MKYIHYNIEASRKCLKVRYLTLKMQWTANTFIHTHTLTSWVAPIKSLYKSDQTPSLMHIMIESAFRQASGLTSDLRDTARGKWGHQRDPFLSEHAAV